MSTDQQISIAIPTYNRSAYLRLCIRLIVAVNKDEDDDIDIYVSDNASDDNTEEVVRNMMREYEFIRYFRNDISVPPDQNFQKALLLPDTDYVWLLGDTYTIPDGTLACVRETLSNSQYDLIIVNVSNRVTDVDEQVFTDKNKLLSDLGWHMTCLSTLIFSRELLKKTDFSRYRDTNFLQTGIIFEYLADKPIKVKWIPQHSVLGIDVPGVKKKSWEGQTFEIWTKRWANFVFSLPAAYSLDAKMKCIMDHGFKSKVFTLSALKHLRRKGILNLETYRNYSRYFPLTIKYPPLLIRLLAMLPRSVTRLF